MSIAIGKNTVAVLLATYNGEQYLDEQIDSILNQSYTDVVVFARDDGSSDGTACILSKRATESTGRFFEIYDSGLVGGGSKENFGAVLQWVNSRFRFNYFMFSDQDDVWLPDKIAKSIAACKRAEADGSPVLVHTDLKVVDANLHVLGESFVRYRALRTDVRDLNHLLVQNNMTGCTMLWNASFNALFNLSSPSIAMHDWWMALVAAALGKIVFVDEPTVLYRQHEDNVVGATKVHSIAFIWNRITVSAHVRETISLSFDQAAAFLDTYASALSPKEREIIKRFLTLRYKSKFCRLISMFHNGYLKQGIIQVIGQVLYV